MKKALVLVDIQNDFLPGGALAVPDGDAIIPLINALIPKFDIVVATQDYHPADHGSFAKNHDGKAIGEIIDLNGLQQILWPIHCVQGAKGSDFAADLSMSRVDKIFTKGEDKSVDSYSGFFDNGKQNPSGLAEFLNDAGVDRLFVVGLATDYCVKYTAIDAFELGFETIVISDATRAVNLNPGDFDKAISEMHSLGIKIMSSGEI